MTKRKNSAADTFFKSMKDNPQEIIAWCKREIEAYERLIELIEGTKKTKSVDLMASDLFD